MHCPLPVKDTREDANRFVPPFWSPSGLALLLNLRETLFPGDLEADPLSPPPCLPFYFV